MHNDKKTWSLTKEYEDNKNNIIFKDTFPLKRILSDLSKGVYFLRIEGYSPIKFLKN